MSQITEYVRKCPENVLRRIEKASKARLYVLQEKGPLGFIISEDGDDENPKKHRITLGTTHSCSCNRYVSEGSLCIHTVSMM
jgi:hypothetical protein